VRGPAGTRRFYEASTASSNREEALAVSELIDTTEMYLKTVYEMEEDGVLPLRARIVERLEHSGPTVSQTVARMERDGLIHVAEDRSLQLTEEGRARATEVIRKHRLAERLLLDVIGMDRRLIHEEACRWEHVMSEQVEGRLAQILQDTDTDPFGNSIPPCAAAVALKALTLTFCRSCTSRAYRASRKAGGKDPGPVDRASARSAAAL